MAAKAASSAPFLQSRAAATAFDTAIFNATREVVALRVPVKRCAAFMKSLQGCLLNYPRMRNIVTDEASADNSTKLLLLSDKLKDVSELPEAEAQFVSAEGVGNTKFSFDLDYTYYGADECFKKLLPADIEAPASFETIGHVAHLNLRDSHEPFKHVIGQVILDKNRGIRTVVNKLGSIASEFRTFEMEVLAGVDDMDVEVKESKSVFKFNFAEVYWNSRLQQEHGRLVAKFSNKDVICDMFCGIGPFAVPAGRKGCTVHANDLNPRSYHYLVSNCKANKVEDKVTCYNLDARAFLAQLVADNVAFTQVCMNLPMDAVEFCDVFRGRFDSWHARGIALPTVHCYCFSMKEDFGGCKEDVLTRVEKALGCPLDRSTVTLFQVRDVAPKKLMMCVSFPLPPACAYTDSVAAEAAAAAAAAAGGGGATAADGAKRGRDEAEEAAPDAKKSATEATTAKA